MDGELNSDKKKIGTGLIASATAIILRSNEIGAGDFNVLLLKRNSKLTTHGGGWVFPGGKVDCADFKVLDENVQMDGEASQHFTKLNTDEQLLVAKTAAVRETFEESSLQVEEKSLLLCSTWLTPEEMKKRFNTWFFIARNENENVRVDGSEISDFRWFNPKEALESQESGEISLPPPTYITLKYLAQYKSLELAITEMSQSPVHYKPRLVPIAGGFCSLYEDDEGYLTKNLHSEGLKHRLFMSNGKFDYVRSDYSSA